MSALARSSRSEAMAMQQIPTGSPFVKPLTMLRAALAIVLSTLLLACGGGEFTTWKFNIFTIQCSFYILYGKAVCC
jgi:hypothetical protein